MKRRRILFWLSIAFALILIAGLSLFVARRSQTTRASLLVEARVRYYKADEQPVASATLYLLDQDIIRLALVKEGEPASPLQEKLFRENPKLRNLAGIMNARRREAYPLSPDVAPFVEQSRPLWQPHVIRTALTDGAGRARFSNLAPGDYWLMCLVEMRGGGVAFWNLFVTVHSGDNSVKLEPLNSLQCSSCQ